MNVTDAEKDNLQSKWVRNLSDHNLSPSEAAVLKRGLNFAVTPSKIPVHEYVIGVESACRILGLETHDAARLRADCTRIIKNAKPPTPNITAEEQEALKSLSKDNNITILPADKGRLIVLMNTKDYISKSMDLLGDTNTYQVLKRDPTNKFADELKSKLWEIRQADNISDAEYRHLLPTTRLAPRYYGLPKVHKPPPVPLRPIVACRGSITYNVARRVADIISPMVGKNAHALKNSGHLVSSMKNCVLQEDDILLSCDVTQLFTKVPVDKSLDLIYAKLNTDETLKERTLMTPTQVRDLLAICLKTTYFVFQGVIYTQVEGAAMGSPVSPIVANLYMEWFEEHAILTFQYEITIWKRYVDDTILAICDALVDDLMKHLNSIEPAIQFTHELEVEGKLPMLDTLTTRRPSGRLEFSVYRKPTHTDQYLQFDSNQPLQHKLGVVRTLRHRCESLCSTEEAKLHELEHLRRVLSVSGYTKSAWDTASRPKPPSPPPDPDAIKKKGHISLPYVGPMSNSIARVIRKAGVAVHMRPYNTIRSQLVHPKDKVEPSDKAGVVYHIQCGDCTASYVGETERCLGKRVKEHAYRGSSSSFEEHCRLHKHSTNSAGKVTIPDSQVRVLHQEPDWFKRGVAESLHIMREDPSLNRDKGRHTLPEIYRELLSRDRSGHGESHAPSNGGRQFTRRSGRERSEN